MSEIVEKLKNILISPESPTDRLLHELVELAVYGGLGYIIRMVTED